MWYAYRNTFQKVIAVLPIKVSSPSLPVLPVLPVCSGLLSRHAVPTLECALPAVPWLGCDAVARPERGGGLGGGVPAVQPGPVHSAGCDQGARVGRPRDWSGQRVLSSVQCAGRCSGQTQPRGHLQSRERLSTEPSWSNWDYWEGLTGTLGSQSCCRSLITRWKRDSEGRKVLHPGSKKYILQFVSIKRKDCGEWAIPGGMVDPGEKVSVTLRREFGEEALNALQQTEEQRERLKQQITELFNSSSFQVYKGYVDDPRNTDNAWMETVAVNYHDDSGSSVAQLPLEAGDDAGKVAWVEIDSTLRLYASHARFLEIIARERGAHWE
ncbi:ADP-ribose pyrophosphatase, mitochondrial [Polyodon spathula]|uniref:ADP-ribose pyrophosphatase, mitochondrial n=1 Tax=Polyodon spathula TaxID=7913 RepID=UPI001B7EE414|nr:ADP-ribose pyrophosphatase, mitochondrial [Polyodon spathula]